MERLIDGGGLPPRQRIRQTLAMLLEWLMWEIKRAARTMTRRFGAWLWGLLLCAALATAGWFMMHRETEAARVLQQHLDERLAQQTRSVALDSRRPGARSEDGRNRLQAFDDFLLPHAEIPTVLQDLLQLAEKEGLLIQRGEYRPQIDVPGKFLRYRMTLPVKGEAAAIQRFMQAALRSQKTLALESVQFKRERIEATVVEARIQWVLFTHLPIQRAALTIDPARGAEQAQ